jgi:hypothetical protein
MECEYVRNVTNGQAVSLSKIEAKLRHVLSSIASQQAEETTWRRLGSTWNGRVLLGSFHLVPEYVPQKGCLTIGLDAAGSPDLIDRAVCRCLAHMVIKTVPKPNCTRLIRDVIDHAETLGVRVDFTCDDFREYGLIGSEKYTNARCGTDVYDRRRQTFEELLGRDVDEAIGMIKAAYPDLHIALRQWDMLGTSGTYDLHSEKRTLVIHYDPVSRKVVLPEPQLASMQMMDGPYGNCFMMPTEGRCIGAPRIADASWDSLIGGLLTDVTDTLRFNYPHAVVETTPVGYLIPSSRRRDRIRVSYDPKTARVVSVTLG